MPTPALIHAQLRLATNPAQLSGFIGNTQVDHVDVEWVLENFGEHPIVWLGLLGRQDLSEDWIQRASRVPDPAVLGRVLMHRYTTRQTVEWILMFAQQLVDELRASTEVNTSQLPESLERTQRESVAMHEVVLYAQRILNGLDGGSVRS